jgi:hypothetical protein
MDHQLPRPTCPFPYAVSPYEAEAQKFINNLISMSYTFYSEADRKKFQLYNLGGVATRTIPAFTHETGLLKHARFILWATVLDDYHESCNAQQIKQTGQRIVNILRGDKPAPDEIAIYHQTALMREEMSSINDDWYYRFIETVDFQVNYGMVVEASYRRAQSFPPLRDFMFFRECCLFMYPWIMWLEPAINFILPRHIDRHPVIMRLRALQVRIGCWQNDFFSLPKELTRKSEVMNLVLVLQHEHNISLEEAWMEALHIYDEDIKDFITLQSNLPDFGAHQEEVEKYVLHLSMMIGGLHKWYSEETPRYQSSEFVEPGYIPQ